MDRFRSSIQPLLNDDDNALSEDLFVKGGHPDAGSGRFAHGLAYKDWYEFNNAQRVHINYVEQLPCILLLIGLTTITQPLAALILSSAYFVFRIIYTIGYFSGGPNARALGAIPMTLIKFTLFGFSIYTSV